MAKHKHGGWVISVRFSHDGTWVASGAADKWLRVFFGGGQGRSGHSAKEMTEDEALEMAPKKAMEVKMGQSLVM